MRVYCDTDTLFHNIAKHLNQPAVQAELNALQLLLSFVAFTSGKDCNFEGTARA